MALDDTVQRGDLGVVGSVWDCEAGERYVHFANWEGTMPERQLNMCTMAGVQMLLPRKAFKCLSNRGKSPRRKGRAPI